MKKLPAHWQMLIALILAASTGWLFRRLDNAGSGEFISAAVATCEFIGNLFMQALKMIIVPLVAASIIAGIAGLGNVKGFGKLGLKTLGFYSMTSLLAILVGVMFVNVLEPGRTNGEANREIQAAFDREHEQASEANLAKVESANSKKGSDFVDIFKKMVPPNIFAAASNNGQLIGLIFFSILFAIAMTSLPARQMEPLLGGVSALHEVMVRMTQWIMVMAPIGVFGLLLPVVYETGPELFLSLGKYFLTVLLALGTHLFITMPLVLKLCGNVNPWAHMKAMRVALMTAFSTASSSATLPETMVCVEENSGVSKRVTGFTLPLGATVNMDGTALYECVAVLFVAQVMDIPLGLVAQFGIVLTALLTSIGVAGVPSASLVAILIILNNSGIPNANVAVTALLAVDRLLDMTRTAVNVFGDSCCAVVIAKSEGESLKV